MKLGEAVSIVRSARGWTQEQLSEASRVSRLTISQIEIGGRTPRRATVYKLAKALRIPSDVLSNPRITEAQLLEAMRIPRKSRNGAGPKPAAGATSPSRTVPVVHGQDLDGIYIRDGADVASDRALPARTDDPLAFYLVAEGQELTWDTKCPEGAELLLEPSVPPESGDLVIVRSPAGLALRRLNLSEGQRELRSLTPAQATIVWSPGLELARVGRVMVDPHLWK